MSAAAFVKSLEAFIEAKFDYLSHPGDETAGRLVDCRTHLYALLVEDE